MRMPFLMPPVSHPAQPRKGTAVYLMFGRLILSI